jgi:hypothetical protein
MRGKADNLARGLVRFHERLILKHRRSSLVCQHLENISREVLEKYQATVRDYVRMRHGVYALYRRGKLYYVGLAGNLRSRLKTHLKDRHGESWDRFSVYLTIGDSHMKELESLILRMVKPTGNRTAGKFTRSEDLRKALARDIRKRLRTEVSELFGRRKIVEKMPKTTPRRQKGRSPVLAHYVQDRLKLRARHHGRRVIARVRRDGSIRYAGKLFTSPSLAAVAVCRRPMNGWHFWTYERAPGDWVSLNELRK